MGESLGVSVSFGKYENDALSWEKWSTFSPNKYLEEVGKCSTPGSVAQKKAFFEAHYKKIAAMKAEAEAELLDQQQDSRSDDQQIKDQHKDCTQTGLCVSDEPVSVTNGSGKFQEDKPLTDEVDVEPMQVLPSEAPTTSNSNADKLEEAVLVNVESMKLVKQHFQVDLETQDPPQIRQPKPQNVTRKVTPNKVEKNPIGMKEKPASLIPKSPETPASTLSKPKLKPKPTSATTLKKASAPSSSAVSSSKNKYQSLSESRRVTPVSLHMSMSMSSVNSDTASSVTSSRRRSLFMEQMGDKDIVKRAFKTFQNRVNQLPSSASGPKQVPAKRSEQKTRTSMAYQKENERSRKPPAAEKINPVRGQLGPTWKSVSSRSLKGVGVDERRLKAGPTTIALKSDERAERRKEFLKKLEEKSNARRSEASLKPKEVKDAEMKKTKQKAKAMPGVLKST